MVQLSIRIPSQRNILVALGSNAQHDSMVPSEILPQSLCLLDGRGLRVRSASRLFSTPCFPAGAGPDYVNAAAVLETDLAPGAVLEILHAVEAGFGRERFERWASRPLDLDLLADGDAVLPDRATYDRWRALPPERQRSEAPEGLVLPHPRMHERGFVLVPLADVAPDWRHPVLNRTAAELRDALPAAETARIVPLD